jgi:hypothetical protein
MGMSPQHIFLVGVSIAIWPGPSESEGGVYDSNGAHMEFSLISMRQNDFD